MITRVAGAANLILAVAVMPSSPEPGVDGICTSINTTSGCRSASATAAAASAA